MRNNEIRVSNGYTPLMDAIFCNDEVYVNCFSNSLNCFDRDNEGKTALMHACILENLSIVEILVKSHKDSINMKDNEGKTALMYACAKNNNRIMMCLIKNGANVDIRDNKGKTAFMYSYENSAQYTKHTALYLLEYSRNKRIIVSYSLNNNCKDIVDYMIVNYPWLVLEYTFLNENKVFANKPLLDYIFRNILDCDLKEKIYIFLFAYRCKVSRNMFIYLNKDVDFFNISYIYIYLCLVKHKDTEAKRKFENYYEPILKHAKELLYYGHSKSIYIKQIISNILNYYDISNLKITWEEIYKGKDPFKTPQYYKNEDFSNYILEEHTKIDYASTTGEKSELTCERKRKRNSISPKLHKEEFGNNKKNCIPRDK